jgi:hypothetical protein
MRFPLIPVIIAFFVACATAGTNNVTVPGTADLWLAGQLAGTILNGGFAQNDVAPANSPVLASTGLNMTAGSYLTFSVTGSTTYEPGPPLSCQNTPPDGTGCENTSARSFFGLSTYSGPIDALIGVFIGPGVPGGTAPTGLDFTTLTAQSQGTISPLLNQVFFIGDGLTGNGTGSVQQFIIPAGATQLYLGSSDAAGANYNNGGSFSVAVSDVPSGTGPSPVAAPAASTFALVLTGLLLATISGYCLLGRSRAA